MSQTPYLKHSQPLPDPFRSTGYSHKFIPKRGRDALFSSTNPNPAGFYRSDSKGSESMVKVTLKPNNFLLGKSPPQGEKIRRKKDRSHSRKVRVTKSPYLSEAAPIERMMRLLIPVLGPNESLKQSIKKHDEMNIKNAELM